MANFKTVKFKDNHFEMDVYLSLDEKTIWLTQKQIARLFNISVSGINHHIKKILKEGKIDDSVINAELIPGADGKNYLTKIYNLKMILTLSIKVGSDRGLLLQEFLNKQVEDSFNLPSEKFNNIIIYNNDKVNISLEMNEKRDTIWADQEQIAAIFEATQQNISLHIKNILNDKELDINSVHKDFLYTASDGKNYFVSFYNLDMILAIGYRVNTKRAISFRKWASSVLKEYIFHGYSIDKEKCLECQNNILELQRDILKLKGEMYKQINFKPGDEPIIHQAIVDFLKTVEHEIVIIDNYFGHDFDEVLSQLNIKKTIITNIKNSKIDTNTNYKVIKRNDIHDRYIIVDDVGYHFGTSITDLGSNISSSARIEDKNFINYLKDLVH